MFLGVGLGSGNVLGTEIDGAIRISGAAARRHPAARSPRLVPHGEFRGRPLRDQRACRGARQTASHN